MTTAAPGSKGRAEGEQAGLREESLSSTGIGGRGASGGGDAKDHNRGLVFAVATKPLEAIAASLDKALGGGAGGGDAELELRAMGKGGGLPPSPPRAEYLREELGLNARVRRATGGDCPIVPGAIDSIFRESSWYLQCSRGWS